MNRPNALNNALASLAPNPFQQVFTHPPSAKENFNSYCIVKETPQLDHNPKYTRPAEVFRRNESAEIFQADATERIVLANFAGDHWKVMLRTLQCSKRKEPHPPLHSLSTCPKCERPASLNLRKSLGNFVLL